MPDSAAPPNHWLDLASLHTSDQPPATPPPPKPMKPLPFKRHLKFVIGIIVIGCLILAVGITWLFSQVHQSSADKTHPTPTPIIKTTPTPSPTPTPTPSPSPTPTPIDKATIHIVVLNGTTQKGLAAKVAQQLQQAGFIIDKTGNADSQSHPSLAYPTGQDTAAALIASTLESSYPNITQQATSTTTQFTLILGQ